MNSEQATVTAPTNDSAPARPATPRGGHRGLSIQLRLLALVIAATLPPVVFSTFQVRRANDQARANVETVALQLAQRAATRIDDHVSVVDALLITLTRVVRTDPTGQSFNDALLASVRRDLGGRRFLNLSVADASGHVIGISNTPRAGTLMDVSDRKYFREAMANRGMGIGEPMVGRVTGQQALAIGRAVLGPDGEPRGVVAASTMLDELRGLLVPAKLPPEANVSLVDERGRVLARTADDADIVEGDSLGGVWAASTTAEGVREFAGADGVARLYGFATATRVPWKVFVGIPTEVALAQVHELEREALLLGIVSLMLSIGLAWLIARGIARPIMSLTSDAEEFASGNLLHRSRVNADGEVGRLAETFNRMATALQGRSDDLTESERRYRILFETLPLPLWVYDVQTYRFLEVNTAAVARYGYTRDEFLRMTVLDFLPREEVGRAVQVIDNIQRDRVVGALWKHCTAAGEMLDVEITSNDLLVGDRRARLAVGVDITARNRTEAALRASQEQLRQSQKMEAIGSLAGGIAHDFNNLLTAILGYCDLALESAPAGTALSDDVHEIRRAARRAAELTHQLLAFSRRQMLKPTVFGLNLAAEGTEKILRRLISESIVLELSLASESPFVRADPSQVEQVILNLAVNARDAMSRGGRLVLETGRRTFSEVHPVVGGSLPPGDYASLCVMDTGTGISPEVLERLFEPFFTTKERGHGTGLGLATVYGIVQQSGGGVDVRSTVGVGSTFTVYFPLAAEPTHAAIGPQPRVTSSKGEGTILLAEDDDAVRAIACTTLQRAGYTVLAAGDGARAVAISDAHAGPIDLLLTDVIMPAMNGRELAELMAVRRPGMPVLFVSGYTDNVLADLGLPSADHALLDKPFTPASLTAAVAAILGTEKSTVAP